DRLQLAGTPAVALTEPAAERLPDFLGQLTLWIQRTVVDVPQQRFLFLVAGAGQVDERAGVGRQDQAHAPRQAKAQHEVVLGGSIRHHADAAWYAIHEANESFLHLRRQAGDRAARNAGLGAELVTIAGKLHDRP